MYEPIHRTVYRRETIVRENIPWPHGAGVRKGCGYTGRA